MDDQIFMSDESSRGQALDTVNEKKSISSENLGKKSKHDSSKKVDTPAFGKNKSKGFFRDKSLSLTMGSSIQPNSTQRVQNSKGGVATW